MAIKKAPPNKRESLFKEADCDLFNNHFMRGCFVVTGNCIEINAR
jgi:hypothetical protein